MLLLERDPHFAESLASLPLFTMTLSIFPLFEAATIRVAAFEVVPSDSVDPSLRAQVQLDAANDELRKTLRRDYADQRKALLDGAVVTASATAERRLTGWGSMFPTPWMSSSGERAGPPRSGGQILDEYESQVAEALAIEALLAVLQR